ncbi:ribosomal RNA-processing protein 7-domain-containing protein [Hypoxylon sp. NC1633]|nr:ribosomal RNA-processing protein 7-domain-containing protein [Hypoxylon sp. NC1633]
MSEATVPDDFVTFPLTIPPRLSFYSLEIVHYMYCRRNAPKIPTPDDSRSLFIVNVPSDSTELHFRALFANIIGVGKFESITFEHDKKKPKASHEPAQALRLSAHRKRKHIEEEAQNAKEEALSELPSTWTRQLYPSGSSAVVLLADEKSVELFFKAVKKLRKPPYPIWGYGPGDGNKDPPLGSQWLKEHIKLSHPGNDVVRAAVDAYFTVYNRKEKEAGRLAKRLRNEPDEDGFVTVTRGGRAAPAKRDEAEEAKQKMLERQQKKKDEMTDFYRFQMREKRKAEQEELLKRFEEDKKKVQAMKEKRGKFRPET